MESPGSGEVEVNGAGWRPPGQAVYEPHYTAPVRVTPLHGLLETVKPDTARELPPPTAAESVVAADQPV